jgi:hypothetical protein
LRRALDPVQVDAVGAGRPVLDPDGILRMPLDVQIVYAHDGEFEVRQSQVECLVDRDGRVVALEDLGENSSGTPYELRQLDDVESTASLPRIAADPIDVVEAFYQALGAGDGDAASRYVVPEKQLEGPLSAGEISRYFGGLARPLHTHRIEEVAADRYEVKYSYGIGSRYCAGSARVTLTERGRATFIESITASENCS